MWHLKKKTQILGLLYGFLLFQILGGAYTTVWEQAVQVDAVSDNVPPKIALTFDDGPNALYTPELLDGLKERGVKATFFLVGVNIEKDDNALIVKRMAQEGHLIGNHTFHHVELTKLDTIDALEELEETNLLIERITGDSVQFVRPPFGEWSKTLGEDVTMFPVMWSIDPLDWSVKNTEEIVRKVVTQAKENDMILLHDCYQTSVEAALQIVDILQQQGFEFVTVDELLLP
ncbi:MAG: polysaccharide deacetylase family protein [Candidatus Ruminococcus intestinipullorum]|nr:polysaccharide deacetylase family protein [Candidatus Ruminococcus intestinipullorum]